MASATLALSSMDRNKDSVSIWEAQNDSRRVVRIWRGAVDDDPSKIRDTLCVEYKNDIQDGRATRYALTGDGMKIYNYIMLAGTRVKGSERCVSTEDEAFFTRLPD